MNGLITESVSAYPHSPSLNITRFSQFEDIALIEKQKFA